MHLPGFEYHAPDSLEEAARVYTDHGSKAAFCGGGTDLFVRMKQGLATPSHVISLVKLPGVRGISYDFTTGLELGAGVTLSALAEHPAVVAHYPALASAASLIATHQIRNMATLGGNILQENRCMFFNRSAEWRKAVAPCIKRGGEICHAVEKGNRCFAVYQGDLAPLIISLRGTATLVSRKGMDEYPLEDLFSGDGLTPLRKISGKILTRIRIPVPPHRGYSHYKKFRMRKGMDFPLAGAAIAVAYNGHTIDDMRICLTGISSSPVVVKETKELAAGKYLSPDLMEKLTRRAYTSARPVANLEDSPAHRRLMVRTLVEETLEEAMNR